MPAVRRDEDRVGRQQRVVFGDDRHELVEKFFALLQPALRQIGRRAADGDIAVRQPRAADLLEQVENLFPLAEGVQERAERAQVEPVGAHADQVAGDAAHLGDDHPQMPGLFGQFVASAAFRPSAPSRDSCSSRPDSPSGRCRESIAAA